MKEKTVFVAVPGCNQYWAGRVYNCCVYFYPHAFKKKKSKGDIVIVSVCLSVRPLCYLLLNHWVKFIKIWCVSYSHEWGPQWQFFWPNSWGSGEVSKGQISFNFNYKVNFKDFHTKLCVFSKMNDSKHIRRDFHSVTWVTPQGWDFGAQGVPRGSIFFFQTWSCGISNRQG